MKKLILSAVVALSGIVGLNAQSMESLQLGVKAGYNYNTLRGKSAKDIDTKGSNGYYVGLFTEVPVNERFSIQPEVIYSAQGAKWESSGALGTHSVTLKSQYLNVPVLAKFYVADGFNLQLGPQVGFLTGAKMEGEGLGELANDNKFNEKMGKVDFGLVFGAGYKTPVGLTIDARYNLGLTNVLDKDNESIKKMQVSENNDFKNGVFSVGVGYQF